MLVLEPGLVMNPAWSRYSRIEWPRGHSYPGRCGDLPSQNHGKWSHREEDTSLRPNIFSDPNPNQLPVSYLLPERDKHDAWTRL